MQHKLKPISKIILMPIKLPDATQQKIPNFPRYYPPTFQKFQIDNQPQYNAKLINIYNRMR